jgi:hypothetical protein
MTVDDWLAAAASDARTHGLAELARILDALARATDQLRAADWNADASGCAGADDPPEDAA